MNREDFEIFDTGIIYLDNAATTMKPKSVVQSIVDYYTKYTANAHRGDYDNSLNVDNKYEGAREIVKEFINALSTKEVVFTKGSTESFNMVVFGFLANYLKKDDEILVTKIEHASTILPLINLSKRIGFKIKYINLLSDFSLDIDSLKREINEKTKLISIAHITNALGDIRDIESVGKIAKEHNILFMVDATQSIGHIKVDVIKNNIDFMGFSAHKMLGPTGVGVLYGKKELLEQLIPTEYGGGMNISFNSKSEYELKELPSRLEAGTRNIAGVIGLGAAIEYINSIGIEKIHAYEIELKRYLLESLEKLPYIRMYHKEENSGVLLFNVDKYFSQDVAIYLNKFKICIRAGNHCVRMLEEELKVTNTCRISLYFYNTKEEIDKLVEVLKKPEEILSTLI